MHNYTKIKGFDSGKITSLPNGESVFNLQVSFQSSPKINCILITRLISLRTADVFSVVSSLPPIDWSCRVGNLLQPIRSTTQIWVHFSDVISRGNHRWRREMSSVFSGYLKLCFKIFRKRSHRICLNFAIIEATEAGISSPKRFLKKLSGTEKHKGK